MKLKAIIMANGVATPVVCKRHVTEPKEYRLGTWGFKCLIPVYRAKQKVRIVFDDGREGEAVLESMYWRMSRDNPEATYVGVGELSEAVVRS